MPGDRATGVGNIGQRPYTANSSPYLYQKIRINEDEVTANRAAANGSRTGRLASTIFNGSQSSDT
jgi:hypothetical protein